MYERAYVDRPFSSSIASESEYRQVRKNEYPSKSLHLAYLPEQIEPTQWIALTNGIQVTYDQWYDDKHDVDPNGYTQPPDDVSATISSQKAQKYTIRGTFVDPIVTGSVRTATGHIENAVDSVQSATKFNAEIERLSTYPAGGHGLNSPNDSTDYTGQHSPVINVDGVGSTSVERLARTFGTYYNVTEADDRSISNCLSEWHRVDSVDLIEQINESVNRYEQFRGQEDWDRVDLAPDTWIDYPKEQPK
ncbi:hypothetical protein EXE53_00805 [Halorubrum sp. SD626R]|uniref:hypothetical protein n=1 Tax=Halorubrum sp. SD626R TaxID=1419722 RepID=UPI000A9FD8A8|nr:hypothetical protein [Halorubrum sp. SD626R]TKX82180.1 hypothetical protein EXE53_00805 [Halorubrum sp. SD626R]